MEIKLNTEWNPVDNPKNTVRVKRVSSCGVLFEEIKSGLLFETSPDNFLLYYRNHTVTNAVDSPQHYQVFPDKEAIEIIASSMTTEQFYGYCLGNFLKYRLRIGAKDEVQQELGKSNKYKELYEKHKHLCK